MTIAFWAIAALLIGCALLFVLPPLLRPAGPVQEGISPMAAYRDQRSQIDAELAQGTLTKEQHVQALEELQARVIEEVGEPTREKPAPQKPQSLAFILTVALALPAGALALYGVLGSPAALDPTAVQAQAGGEDAPHALSSEQMLGLIEQLAQKMKENPDDLNGWVMLARSYAATQRLPQAVDAFEHAYKLSPRNPDLLADYADLLALANGRSLEGRPEQLVKEALKIAPQHQKSLALVGTAAFNRNDFAAAAGWWKKLLATLPPGSEEALAVQANIAQAEAGGVRRPAALGAAAAPTAAAAAETAPAAANATVAVEGSVTVAEAVKGSIPKGAILFVFARPTDGSRAPVAAVRVAADKFPFQFKLDDSLAMSPQGRISLQPQVQLVARISKSGNVAPQAGDLTGTAGPVKVGARDVRLVIDEVVK